MDLFHPFNGKLRVRVNGIMIKDNSIVLVHMNSINSRPSFWMPPGGGVQIGETMENALIREVKEETNLDIKVKGLWYITEFIHEPWHAIEFYFNCELITEEIRLGTDPELEHQLLIDAQFMSIDTLASLNLKPTFLLTQLKEDLINPRTFPILLPS